MIVKFVIGLNIPATCPKSTKALKHPTWKLLVSRLSHFLSDTASIQKFIQSKMGNEVPQLNVDFGDFLCK